MGFLVMTVAVVCQADKAVATKHVMVDDSGQGWQSDDLPKLAAWVAKRNRDIASAKNSPKIPPPISGPKIPAGVQAKNFGVAHDKIPKAREWYGGTVSPTKVIGAGDAPERVHVTAIGPGASAALESWRKDPEFRRIESAWGDRLAVQAFDDPANPLVADVGLPAGGSPDIVVQLGSGRVVYRAASDPGPGVIVGEIRKRDPAYDPAKDPSGGSVPAGGFRLAAWVGLVAVVALLLRGERR